MDYTNEKLSFKIKKVIRFFWLYGIRRTVIKVKGQYHMKLKFDVLPSLNKGVTNFKSHVGIIGCGNYAFSNIAFYLKKVNSISIKGVMDIDVNKAASIFKAYGASYYTTDAEKIINDKDIKLVYVSSNHASHAEYAIKCIDAGKNVHIEKPHVVNEDQLSRLIIAMRKKPKSKIFLGFNRPRTKLFRKLKFLLDKETGPMMINWFIAGHEIPDNHWYFNDNEGGRVLGNLCHWTDLTLKLVGIENAFPCIIKPLSAPQSKSDFVISIIFADKSCASITFSAKGHTFEGVREVLNIHKGNLLGNITDFQSLSIDILDKKIVKRKLFRDHGHNENILNSFNNKDGEDQENIITSAKFFLSIRKAIDENKDYEITSKDAFGIEK